MITFRYRWWIIRWHLARIFVGFPVWFGTALLDGCRAFAREFADAWACRPHRGQAEAAYEESVKGRYL